MPIRGRTFLILAMLASQSWTTAHLILCSEKELDKSSLNARDTRICSWIYESDIFGKVTCLQTTRNEFLFSGMPTDARNARFKMFVFGPQQSLCGVVVVVKLLLPPPTHHFCPRHLWHGVRSLPGRVQARSCSWQVSLVRGGSDTWMCKNCFSSQQTIGAAFGAKKVEVEGKSFTLGIWVSPKSGLLEKNDLRNQILMHVQFRFWSSRVRTEGFISWKKRRHEEIFLCFVDSCHVHAQWGQLF